MPHSATLALLTSFPLWALLHPVSAMAESSSTLVERYIAGTFRAMADTALAAPTAAEAAEDLRPLLQRDVALDETARFMLGRYWPTNNTAAGASFQHRFGDFAAEALAAALRAHPDAALSVQGARASGPDIVVQSTLALAGRSFPLTWVVRKDGVKGARQIVDFTIGGIDARITLRTLAGVTLAGDSGNLEGLVALFRHTAARAAGTPANVQDASAP